MNWPLHVTVAAVLERDGRFLMVRESIRGQSVFNQPAGHLEPNETLLQAVVRETLEETAWHIEPTALVGVYRWLHPGGDTFLRFCFSGNLLHEEPDRELDRGIEEALWLSQQELQARGAELRSPLVLQCIEDYLAGSRIDLSILKELN